MKLNSRIIGLIKFLKAFLNFNKKIMLLNKKEQIPEKFYIFVNQLSPITHNNFNLTKIFTSAAYTQCSTDQIFAEKYLNGEINYLPFSQSNKQDLKMISPFHLTAISDYMVEYNAELKRRSSFSIYPSRFSATFAFGDYETCVKVAEKYKWSLNEVKEFRLVSKNSLVRVIKVNMEIISLVRHANKISSIDAQTSEMIWDSYWKGNGEVKMEFPSTKGERQIISSGEIWEYLIEGAVKAI